MVTLYIYAPADRRSRVVVNGVDRGSVGRWFNHQEGESINQKSNREPPTDSKKKVMQFIQPTLLTERGHEIEEVLEAGREGALLVLLQAEVQRGVDDQAQLRNHLK